ncbi:MAG: DUF58 domain-containing protein [Chloroflexi bacterium]|nr:DUF58 domain-containing protein [Chloroflexota bacterium]
MRSLPMCCGLCRCRSKKKLGSAVVGKAWLSVIALLLLTSVVLRHELLLFLSLALLLAASVSLLWERYCLTAVEYRREFSQKRVFFGEEIVLTVEVVNRKPLPLAWLEVEDEIPQGLVPLDARVSSSAKVGRGVLKNLLSLRWYERVRRHYRIRCEARGYHSFGPTRLRSGDIFGFYNKESSTPGEDRLTVYPRVLPISRFGLPSWNPFGDLKLRQWMFEDPSRPFGVRDFVYGDSPRRIHWKATARTQQLQVKLYEPTASYRLVIFLNLNTYGSFWWFQGSEPGLLELAISAAASVANWAIEQGHQVGLSANSPEHWSGDVIRIPPSRDPEQMARILESLARVLPFATMSFEALLRLDSHDLPYGSTIVVVTAVLGKDTMAELVTLKATGHRLAVVFVGDQLPDIEGKGILIYQVQGARAWRDVDAIPVGIVAETR